MQETLNDPTNRISGRTLIDVNKPLVMYGWHVFRISNGSKQQSRLRFCGRIQGISDNSAFTHRADALGRRRGLEDEDAVTTSFGGS